MNKKNPDAIYTSQDVRTIKKIALLINKYYIQGKKLNRYEYYLNGGMDFNESLSLIHYLVEDRKISPQEYSLLKRYCMKETGIIANKKRDFIMSTHYQFGDYVISKTEKEQIWQNIIARGIDEKLIDDLVFSGAVREYAINKGLIKGLTNNSKKNVKKK